MYTGVGFFIMKLWIYMRTIKIFREPVLRMGEAKSFSSYITAKMWFGAAKSKNKNTTGITQTYIASLSNTLAPMPKRTFLVSSSLFKEPRWNMNGIEKQCENLFQKWIQYIRRMKLKLGFFPFFLVPIGLNLWHFCDLLLIYFCRDVAAHFHSRSMPWIMVRVLCPCICSWTPGTNIAFKNLKVTLPTLIVTQQ